LLSKAFFKVITLLGHGPGGENGACLAFDSPKLPVRFETLVEPLADGSVKEVTTITNAKTIPHIAKLLESLQGDEGKKVENDEEKKKDEKQGKDEAEGDDDKDGQGEVKGQEGEGQEVKGQEDEGQEVKGPGVEGQEVKGPGVKGQESESGEEDSFTSLPTADEVKEIDADDSFSNKYKAYIIKEYPFPGLPPMALIHFMGWGVDRDEILPMDSPRIKPRTALSRTGQFTGDKTPAEVVALYGQENINLKAEQARELAEELAHSQGTSDVAVIAAAEAGATAAAAAVAAAKAAG